MQAKRIPERLNYCGGIVRKIVWTNGSKQFSKKFPSQTQKRFFLMLHTDNRETVFFIAVKIDRFIYPATDQKVVSIDFDYSIKPLQEIGKIISCEWQFVDSSTAAKKTKIPEKIFIHEFTKPAWLLGNGGSFCITAKRKIWTKKGLN